MARFGWRRCGFEGTRGFRMRGYGGSLGQLTVEVPWKSPVLRKIDKEFFGKIAFQS